MKLRPRTLKMKEAMDLILNSNDSYFGDSDSDDDDDVENTDPSTSVSADDATSESDSEPEDNKPLAKLVTSQVPVQLSAERWQGTVKTRPRQLRQSCVGGSESGLLCGGLITGQWRWHLLSLVHCQFKRSVAGTKFRSHSPISIDHSLFINIIDQWVARISWMLSLHITVSSCGQSAGTCICSNFWHTVTADGCSHQCLAAVPLRLSTAWHFTQGNLQTSTFPGSFWVRPNPDQCWTRS